MSARMFLGTAALFFAALAGPAWPSTAPESYQKPPQPIVDVLNAPPLPAVFLSPPRDAFLILRGDPYPPISDLAEPMLKLAGVRLNPNTNGPHRAPYWKSLAYLAVSDGAERPVALPPGLRIGAPVWSADGKSFAFTSTTPSGIELWVADVATRTARRLEGVRLNAGLGKPVRWMPDQRTLLATLLPDGRGPQPPVAPVPDGPSVQEGSGKSGIGSTYETRDVLRNARDEESFDYYMSSQLALVDAVTGAITRLGKPDLHLEPDPSQDGKYILVELIRRPYSHFHTYPRFPREIEVWDRLGNRVRSVASLPLADQVPIHGVPTGPRDLSWRSTAPATLVWAEALDGGDPLAKVPHRDRVVAWSAPFEGEPGELLRLEQRFAGLVWGQSGSDALVTEYDRERRWKRTYWIRPDEPARPRQLLWDLSVNDKYRDPGSPSMRLTAAGALVFEQEGDRILLHGPGASTEGDRPFLDRFHLRTRATERLFRCDRNSYEYYSGMLDARWGTFLTRRESPSDPANFHVRTLGKQTRRWMPGESQFVSATRPVTRFTDPTPQLRGIQKRIVAYGRADGVPLSFTLYLPPDHREGTRLPTVLWAYPLEYSDPETAGQVAGSDRRFTLIGGPSHLFFLLAGYAVLHNATMPVIAHPDSVYDHFVNQLVDGAKAAIDKAVALGVTDRDRVGVMGHSHGGRMAANLLAHSDLFRAGIARSGAYNQTLVPFGFQGERRTLYEARDSYLRVSPMLVADKINEPILLIHGEIDSNPGTLPFQSDLLYRAVVGTGGTARLVTLPLESHGYEARESVEHTLWEMLGWFDRYVKNAGARAELPRRE